MTLAFETICGLIYPDNYIGSASGMSEDTELRFSGLNCPLQTDFFSLKELHSSSFIPAPPEGDPPAALLAGKSRLSLGPVNPGVLGFISKHQHACSIN